MLSYVLALDIGRSFFALGFGSAPFDFPSPARLMPGSADALARIAVRVFKPAPSLKARQKCEPHGPTKILAAHRYLFSVNALTAGKSPPSESRE